MQHAIIAAAVVLSAVVLVLVVFQLAIARRRSEELWERSAMTLARIRQLTAEVGRAHAETMRSLHRLHVLAALAADVRQLRQAVPTTEAEEQAQLVAMVGGSGGIVWEALDVGPSLIGEQLRSDCRCDGSPCSCASHALGSVGE